MGQDIVTARFGPRDLGEFAKRLRRETGLLADFAKTGKLSARGPVVGCELEAWLTDRAFAPAPINQRFAELMRDPPVALELARFNVEFNGRPRRLVGHALNEIERELEALWARGVQVATDLDARLLSIGTLPTLETGHLRMDWLTPMNRYRALNEQVLRLRGGQPFRLEVHGRQHLLLEHDSMLLQAAGTSFQIHIQAPLERINRLYDAALAVSAPMLALGANSPYLFGVDVWDESRMPLFEQTLDASGKPLRRIGLGSGYVHQSITELFDENLRLPVLLPMLFDDEPEQLSHLRLHNGTIWRWNRPLVGFDDDGTPHVRIEHRALPGSPSLLDAVSDIAFFCGLIEAVSAHISDLPARLPFATVKENFQQAARHGLGACITWLNGAKSEVRALVLDELLPAARRGLRDLGIRIEDCDRYLAIVGRRVERGQNGASWQRAFVARHGHDMRVLAAAYAENQRSGAPVHGWGL